MGKKNTKPRIIIFAHTYIYFLIGNELLFAHITFLSGNELFARPNWKRKKKPKMRCKLQPE